MFRTPSLAGSSGEDSPNLAGWGIAVHPGAQEEIMTNDAVIVRSIRERGGFAYEFRLTGGRRYETNVLPTAAHCLATLASLTEKQWVSRDVLVRVIRMMADDMEVPR